MEENKKKKDVTEIIGTVLVVLMFVGVLIFGIIDLAAGLSDKDIYSVDKSYVRSRGVVTSVSELCSYSRKIAFFDLETEHYYTVYLLDEKTHQEKVAVVRASEDWYNDIYDTEDGQIKDNVTVEGLVREYSLNVRETVNDVFKAFNIIQNSDGSQHYIINNKNFYIDLNYGKATLLKFIGAALIAVSLIVSYIGKKAAKGGKRKGIYSVISGVSLLVAMCLIAYVLVIYLG